jgi:hypothetical protein
MTKMLRLILLIAVAFSVVPALLVSQTPATAEHTSTDELRNVDFYPNPVKTFLTIDFNNYVAGNNAIYQISIYNSLGKQIHTEQASLSTVKIDFTAFEPGMYFVEVKSGDYKITRRIQKDK